MSFKIEVSYPGKPYVLVHEEKTVEAARRRYNSLRTKNGAIKRMRLGSQTIAQSPGGWSRPDRE
jgi:hypothetical protein